MNKNFYVVLVPTLYCIVFPCRIISCANNSCVYLYADSIPRKDDNKAFGNYESLI